jgi:fructuronate reductase
MVPATTDADRADVASRLGLADHAAVVAEAHRSWVIEAVDGLPPLADVGVVVTDDIEPYQRRKLWLLNGPHSALAYTGMVSGHTTIAEAAADPDLAGFVQGYIDDVLEVAGLDALDGRQFAADALHRFANVALGHTCVQVGADGSRKLAQRLAPVVAVRQARGLPTTRFAKVAACWLAAAGGLTLGGTGAGRRRLPPVQDPVAAEVGAALARGNDHAAVHVGLATATPRFAAQVARALDGLRRDGGRVLFEVSDRP